MNTCPTIKILKRIRSCLHFAFLTVFLLLSLSLSLSPTQVLAATGINKQINFQGKVVNANGTNVANGDYSFLFCLYTTASPATACTAAANNDAVWRESKTLTVTDGIFRTGLGDTTALPGSVDFNTDNIYLGTNFNSDGQMTPLVRFTAVPYAFNALKVAGLTVTDTTGTLTVPNGATITMQGTDTYVGRATTDTLTNKTIGSTGLVFSGATTDITTTAGEALVITPNGAAALTLGTTGVGNTTSITLATDSTGDAEVVLPAQSISAGEILNDTITSTQLNSALTFSALDFVDLGLIVHNTTANQGLILPNAASASPSNPTSGEGYLAWDSAGNQLITYNGASWATVGGGGGYNLVKDETTGLTARTTLAFLGAGVTCADNASQTECTIAGGAAGGVSFATGTADNTTNSNNLIHLQKSGVNRFVVSNSGGLTMNGTDSSIVRTTTAEFATGTVGSNLTNANDQLELSDGTVPNSGNGTITTAGQPVTSAAIGAGAHAITRSDGSYLVIRGGGTGLNIYDSIAGTFVNSTQVLNGIAGAGALSLPRPDGRYRVFHCGGLLTSSLVDPRGTVAVGASVAVTACNAGTVSFKREKDGRFIVFNGGGAVTQIYNPVTDAATIAGPTGTTGTYAAGSLVIPRPDGKALIVNGGTNIATTNRYNPNSGTGDIGVMDAVDTSDDLPAGCEINGAGSIAIRKPDGKYIIMSKVNSSVIYDPVAGTMTQNSSSCTTPASGKGPTVALADGAHAIPMQNGKFLVIHGGALTSADIYDPSTDTFTAHGTAVIAGGAGRHSIMRANGTWQMINGGGTGTNNFDTGLPMTGTTTTYTSDDISTTSLNASSTIRWSAQLEAAYTGRDAATNTAFSSMQFLVRTAVNAAGCTTPLNSATDREILKSGDLIRPGSTDNCIRITVKFNRPIPKRVIEERGTWTGNNSTVIRFDYITPTLFDLSIDNSTVLRRNSFDFTNPNAGSAAPQNETSGPLQGRSEVTLRAEATGDKLYLPHGRLTPLTNLGGGTGSSGYYPGVISGAHPNLSQTTTDGTIVIARDDKQFLVISNGAANASLYDPSISTFTAQSGSGNITTAAVGTGAHAIKRPDGKFFIMLGGATTTTNIYDPNAASGSRFVAGPATTVAIGAGSHSILNADGTFTILHGGAALSTSIYNPVRNTMIVGPATPVAINCGSWAIPRPQYNHYLVGFGGATTGVTTSSIYDANTKIFSATAAAPTLSTAPGCGSFAVQRPDGLWWYATGAGLLTSSVYNPAVNRTVAGPAVVATGRGAHAIPRADGTIMIVHGNAGTATSIYVPWGGTNSADVGFIGSVISTSSPALATAAGAGALSFQRPDGKWVIIVGGATASAVTQIYDAGWYADGQYLSEQVQVPALAANSTLEWKQTPDNFVRMEIRVAASQAALGTTAYTTVGRSGQSINNAGGETWVQIQVNFRRDFPTFCGSLDGVYKSTGGMVYCNRNIAVPTVFEYKLNNGMDLMNLQNNGLSMFRVTSSGNVYTGNGGTFLAGGADLAENYTSAQMLELGEVVIGDPTNPAGVLRSTGQYQSNILGVVSTAPGFVAGAHTDDSYPIALVGRVPVKVSTENGDIKVGDSLTSASIPGYAMKASQAGRVLGKALEGLKDAKECPAFGVGNLTSTKCGEVMMFVNLTDYLGTPVELVMAESQLSGLSSQLSDNSQSVLGLSVTDQQITDQPNSENRQQKTDNSSKQDQILAFLKQLNEKQASASAGYRSEIFTDRVSAVNEVISPLIVTDLLQAKKIKADSIEGLEILTNQISKIRDQNEELAGQIAGVATASAGLSTSEESLEHLPGGVAPAAHLEGGFVAFEGGKFTLDLTVLGKLNANGGLLVLGPSQFKAETIFEKLVTFVSNVIFKGKVTFEEVPVFNKDTAGFAVIAKDADEVAVSFEKDYVQTPIVLASISLDTAEENFKDKPLDEQVKAQEALEKDIISYDLRYFVTKRDSRGFAIRLNKKASLDVPFSWHAIVVKDAAIFRSKPPAIEPTSTPSPIPFKTATPTPAPSPTIEPSATPSPEATPSASSPQL